MKYVDEFQDKKITDKIISALKDLNSRSVNLMEVCGTHTVSIFRSGIKNLLPPNINLISGPGCPVCVTSQRDIDQMIALAKKPEVITTTFGDMLKVPGSKSSLERERANGNDIRIIYSPLDALEIAKENKNKEIVFLAVGFETTSPAVASVIADAKKAKIRNFSIYSSHKIVTPAIQALLKAQEIKLDGFILPGHVSAIIGSHAYNFIAKDYKAPCVISGFEPVDILESILMLLKQIIKKEAKVEIQYSRVVRPEGNILAQKLLAKIFTLCDTDWRGISWIKKSGYKLNKEYQNFDAKEKFNLRISGSIAPKNCLCGEILRGIKTPDKCKLFSKVCNPENPYGPCMVSSEGTCAAWYKYNKKYGYL